jgi:hypothetical protein
VPNDGRKDAKCHDPTCGPQGIAPNVHGRRPLPRTVTFPTAVVLTLWCAARALVVDALAGPLERVEFEGASQRLSSGGLILGDRIQGYLAKPEGAGPLPAVIGLHGCTGMPDTTKRKLVDELVGWGYVVLLVDSFATRGIEHACTGGIPDIAGNRRSDAYGAVTECAEARPFLYRERDRVRATWFESRAPIVGSSICWNDPFVVRGAGKFLGRSGASSWNRGSGSGRPWSQ